MNRQRSLIIVLTFILSFTLLATATAQGNVNASPDMDGDVGRYTSLVLDSAGNPVVSYYDLTNGDLKVLHCNDPKCTGGDESITSPDTGDEVGRYTSLVLDSAGNPVVSYYDDSNGDLKLLHCNDPNCTGGDESISSPDTGGDVGLSTSLALSGLGNPVVSYYDYSNGDLKLLLCNDPNCTGDDESVTSADTGGDVGWFTSLALDGNGNPVVSYWDLTNFDLKLLRCNDPNCTGDDESVTSADTNGDVGWDTSLALDGNSNPVVSYWDFGNDDLKLLHCNDHNCAGGDESITSPDTGGFVGEYTSLVLDVDGNPVVSYLASTGSELRVLHCNDPNCAGGDESIASPDTDGFVGQYTSLALDVDGNPVVSYYDNTEVHDGDLKVLHCADPLCTSNSAPLADAGLLYHVDEGGSVTLDASGTTDAEQDPASLTYEWDFDGDGVYDDATGIMPTFSAASIDGPAMRTADLMVTDDGGFNSKAKAAIIVDNLAPVADAGGPYAVDEGGSVILDASGTTDVAQDQETLTYAWDFDGDGQYDDATGIMPTFSTAALDGPDMVTIALQAMDDGFLTDVVTATIDVANVAPTISSVSNDGPVVEAHSVTITVEATDVAGDADPLSYAFDCNNDGEYEVGPQPGNNATCMFVSAGGFTVSAQVTDGDGGEATDSTEVVVEPVFWIYAPLFVYR